MNGLTVVRPLLAGAVALAAFTAPQPAQATCVYRHPVGGACVTVRPDDPNDPIDVTCGGAYWTCAPIV